MKTCALLAFLAASAWAQAPFAGTIASDKNPVVAQVNGLSITVEDVRHMVDSAEPRMLQLFKQNPQMALQQTFLMKYLATEGEKLKLAETSPLKDQLEMLRANVVAGAMVNHERDHFQVSEKDTDLFYQKNRERYEQAKIKIIYIAFKPAVTGTKAEDIQAAARAALEGAHTPNQRTDPEAKALASEIVAKLRGGLDFAKGVEQYSEDPTSKAEHGDFGVVKYTSSYAEDLKKAIFALKNGDISDPIKQTNGYYIVRIEEKSLQPINEVRESIIQELRQAHLDSWLKELNTKFQPKVLRTDFFLTPDKFLNPEGAKKP